VTPNNPNLINGIGLSGFTEMGNITLNKDVVIQTVDGQGSGLGTILIRGNNLSMNNNSFIFSDTNGNVSGAPIGVDIDLTGRLSLFNGARISTETGFLSAGAASAM
jgi:hypothetical protein